MRHPALIGAVRVIILDHPHHAHPVPKDIR